MFKIFNKFSNLKYGISDKNDGPIELVKVLTPNAKNRSAYLSKVNLKKSALALQSHSSIVATASKPGKISGDALITNKKCLALGVTVADCFPIYFYVPKENKIGIAHSGWRGTVGNIVTNVIKKMNVDPKGVLVGIGPGIQKCHFEIKEDILKKFKQYPNAVIKKGNKIFINLPKIIQTQLIDYGVPEKNIEVAKVCTYCKKTLFFSYRRDKPKQVQAMLAYISLIS